MKLKFLAVVLSTLLLVPSFYATNIPTTKKKITIVIGAISTLAGLILTIKDEKLMYLAALGASGVGLTAADSLHPWFDALGFFITAGAAVLAFGHTTHVLFL